MIESNCTNLVPDKPLLKNKTTKLVYGYFSLISIIKTNIYFYQFSSFFQNILNFRAFHYSQWKKLFIGLLLRGNIKISIFQNAMNQSSEGTKAPTAHDAVPVFCEHPLRILNAKPIKFWYSEAASFCIQRLVHGQAIERK